MRAIYHPPSSHHSKVYSRGVVLYKNKKWRPYVRGDFNPLLYTTYRLFFTIQPHLHPSPVRYHLELINICRLFFFILFSIKLFHSSIHVRLLFRYHNLRQDGSGVARHLFCRLVVAGVAHAIVDTKRALCEPFEVMTSRTGTIGLWHQFHSGITSCFCVCLLSRLLNK